MKGKLLLVILFFGMIAAVELQGQFTCIGAAGHYGTAIKEFGVGANTLYTINEKIDIAPGLVYFFPHKEDPEDVRDVGFVQNTWWSVNVDGHYIPIENNQLQIYGLMGLNFTSVDIKEDYLISGDPNTRNKSRTVNPGK